MFYTPLDISWTFRCLLFNKSKQFSMRIDIIMEKEEKKERINISFGLLILISL